MSKKYLKKVLCFLLAIATGISMLTACSGDDGSDTTASTAAGSDTSTASALKEIPKDYKGTLTMWGWDDPYYKAVTEAFKKEYPNVTFQYTPVANGDLLQKYQTALSTGTELPDVGWSIIDSRAKVYELDMWEPLNKAPYNFNINDVFDYLHPIMVNSKGDVCGIEQSISPAGLAYRKDLAKKYLGTDDRKELEKMLPTWEAFIEKGKEVYQKSSGKVYMFPGVADAQQFIREQDTNPWISGTTVNATSTLKRSLELACGFRDNNVADKLEAWSTAWYASFGQDTHIFAGCATWSVPFTIEPNDKNGKTTGHWALMNAPEGNISWGGTTLGITKTCKDKALAWTFIKFATLSTEGAEALNKAGLLTSAKKPYEEKPELKHYKSAWFGDQDIGEVFIDEIAPKIKIRPMNVEDSTVHDTLNDITTSILNDKSLTADKALQKLKDELSMKLPDYTIN